MTVVEPDRQLSPLFADRLQDHDGVAVVTADGEVTYADLDAQVADLAARLGPDRRLILVAAANTLDALLSYLAALRGRHPVLLAPGDNPAAVRALVGAYDPDVVISTGAGCDITERRAATAHHLHDDLALLMSTSGSTGSPKLVRLSRTNLHANAASIAQYLDLTPADRAITTLPMQYCYGLSVINSHLHAGATIVLTGLSVVDRCFWDLFTAAGATSFAGVPHTFDLLDRVGFDSMTLPTLRYVTQAGGRMAPDMVRRYAELGAQDGWDLYVMYGQTEATARMAYLPPALARSRPDAIGVPIPGGHLSIEGADGDGIGELVYRGDNVMLGYAEHRRDLARGASIDALHTGDLARRASDGLYEIVGRRSRFIKPYGIRIDLDRLERLLGERGVEAVCTGNDAQLVVAVADHHRDAASRVVSTELSLPRSHVCVVGVAQLPRLANGKPDYTEVRRLGAAVRASVRPADPAPAAPGGAAAGGAAAAVRTAFADVLGVEPEAHQSFVDLGGDSLSYVEMSIRLEAVLGTLPRSWHITPVGDLVAQPAPGRGVARIDTSVVLRAVAIVLVVGTHAKLWRLPGGAHVLLAVAGYNFARFQRRPAQMLTSVARIAVPSVCWIAVVAAVSDRWQWPNVVLLNGWLGAHSNSWGYWYIEAIVQIVVPLALLFAIPAVRALHRRAPFGTAVAAVAAGLVIRFDLVVDVSTTRTMSRPHEIFWMFALGWAAAGATSHGRRLLVTALAVAAIPGFFGSPSRELVVIAGILLVTWVSTVPMPRPAGRVVGGVAGASLYIYLTHFQVHPLLTRLHSAAVAVVGSVLVGVAVWLVARRALAGAETTLRRWWRRDVPHEVGSRPREGFAPATLPTG